MQKEKSNTHDQNDFIDEIEFQEIFKVLLQGRWSVVSIAGTLSIIGLIFSLFLPNLYESKSLLAPVNQSSSISSAVRSYSSIAGIAGISLPSNKDDGNYEKAIKKVNTLSFFENNILPNIYLPDLMAFRSWNSKTNSILYDENIYNIKNNTWPAYNLNSQKKMPSAQESFEVFKTKHFNIIEDKKSGFVTLSMKHKSPFIAKQWAELVLNEVNAFYREKDKAQSQKAMNYLNQQITDATLSELKQVLAQLLQEETKKLTLIEANKFYVFDYIDPPVVMEKKLEPNRAKIFILSAILGLVLGLFWVLIRHYFIRKI